MESAGERGPVATEEQRGRSGVGGEEFCLWLEAVMEPRWDGNLGQ